LTAFVPETYDLLRMDKTQPTQTIEDYLQLIYTMHREGEEVIAARLKERKGVSAPTAWATLKRMERDGLVSLGGGHRIELSARGQELAESIIRRHMLAERLLTDILKLEWADVHDEAHKMEHAISPLIERQIMSLLNNPTTCPHGNPIPGFEQASESGIVPLRSLAQGQVAVINNIAEHAEDDAELMHYLQRSGLVPGSRLRVDELVPSNGTIALSLLDDDRQVVVGLPTADLVLVGPLYIEAGPCGVSHLAFLNSERPKLPPDALTEARETGAGSDLLALAVRQLEEYFSGSRRAFDLSLDMRGTEFRRRIWSAIAAIPFGVTASYAEIAAAAGAPAAYRAAGSACGANPVAIIVPCHRVIGSDRGLHGFGGGLDTKQWLLRHEGVLSAVKSPRPQPALIS
jgi:DtxR family Mn-dependent transcriptional regulator